MEKTAICIVPDFQGFTVESFQLAKEYCRLCDGIFHERHKVNMFCGKNPLFSPGASVDTLKPFNAPIKLGQNDVPYSIVNAVSSLSTNQPLFQVGHLILIFEDISSFPDVEVPLSTRWFTNWIDQMRSVLHKSFNFDRLTIDMIIFQLGSKREKELTNGYIYIIDSKDKQNIAQRIAKNRLGLSLFSYQTFHVYFLDPFNQSEINTSEVTYLSRSCLIPRVITSFSAVLLNTEFPVMDELKQKMITFDGTYLLSLEHFDGTESPVVRLSYLEDKKLEDKIVANFEFEPPAIKTNVLTQIPFKLTMSTKGSNWVFNRNTIPLAMNIITSCAQVEKSEQAPIIFTPIFLANNFVGQCFIPLFTALSQSNPTTDIFVKAEEGLCWFFSMVANNNPELFPPELYYGKPVTIPQLYKQLLWELEQILKQYSISPPHQTFYQSFQTKLQAIQGIQSSTQIPIIM